MKRSIDPIGEQYESLTVIRQTGKGKEYSGCNDRRWLCRCECGNETVLPTRYLGKVKTCGCGKGGKGNRKPWVSEAHTKHGLSTDPIYSTWRSIKSRCTDPSDPVYSSYGGRNILICKGWSGDITKFVDDLGRQPSHHHTIDRIDNDLGYTCGSCAECRSKGWPMNCKWSTKQEQVNNRSTNHRIQSMGRDLTISQWEEETGINGITIISRIKQRWCPTKAVLMPVMNPRNKPIYHDHNLRQQIAHYYRQGFSVTKLAKRYGVSTPCIRNILKQFNVTEIRKNGQSVDRTRFRKVTARIVAMYMQGYSIRQIKKELRTSKKSIKTVLAEAEVLNQDGDQSP